MYKAKFLKWPLDQLEEMLLIMIAQDEVEGKTFQIAYDAYCNHEMVDKTDIDAMEGLTNGVEDDDAYEPIKL